MIWPLNKFCIFHTCWKDSVKCYIWFSAKLHDVLFIERTAYFNSVKAATHGCLNSYWRDRLEKVKDFLWRDRVDKHHMHMQRKPLWKKRENIYAKREKVKKKKKMDSRSKLFDWLENLEILGMLIFITFFYSWGSCEFTRHLVTWKHLACLNFYFIENYIV